MLLVGLRPLTPALGSEGRVLLVGLLLVGALTPALGSEGCVLLLGLLLFVGALFASF